MSEGNSHMTTDERLHERRQERIAAGREAWAALQKHEHFGQWLAVADALVAIREDAMDQARTNRPQGPPYRRAFKAIIEEKETWAIAIDDSVRAHCYWLVDNLPAVQRWRETLTFKQRDEWNHPSTVKRQYERMTSVKKQQEQAEAQQRKATARTQPVDAMEIIRQLRGGVFTPGTSGEGSDREQRDRAQAAYARIIEGSRVPGAARLWKELHVSPRWQLPSGEEGEAARITPSLPALTASNSL
jgi:hypothetical protein